MNTAEQSIADILTTSRTVAVVGLSDKPERDSHEVAAYLQQHGYRIIPVNPVLAGKQILGETCYASLHDAAQAPAQRDARIDIVDCFRKSEAMSEIAEQAVEIKARTLWMQLGVVNEAAAQIARDGGLELVMDHCMKIEHTRLFAKPKN
ncbi:CoA-binding protein [Lacisediminimonas sp.]|uniref:CoA-binding protein n=1 Tax=Lacisediminimonas sp. TaxID=3060582 RepID=UPI00272038DD|nr:CoA-binding protein [Lacisediminimonas sp.]MDO8298591.1 CoA-binding protein [Lacisediminimonas sp.]MDO9219033.1 CoA-binding protein [Lacisediminimonas sp.]